MNSDYNPINRLTTGKIDSPLDEFTSPKPVGVFKVWVNEQGRYEIKEVKWLERLGEKILDALGLKSTKPEEKNLSLSSSQLESAKHIIKIYNTHRDSLAPVYHEEPDTHIPEQTQTQQKILNDTQPIPRPHSEKLTENKIATLTNNLERKKAQVAHLAPNVKQTTDKFRQHIANLESGITAPEGGKTKEQEIANFKEYIQVREARLERELNQVSELEKEIASLKDAPIGNPRPMTQTTVKNYENKIKKLEEQVDQIHEAKKRANSTTWSQQEVDEVKGLMDDANNLRAQLKKWREKQ